jgi:CelD/BcsL family acetyltransferase involved in cellulose biosynthesis
LTRCDDPAELPRYLEALYDLHERRRMLESDRGTFVRKPLQKRFYPEFARKALANDWLRFYALERAGTIEAIQLGYLYNGAFHQIQEGFNPAFSDGVGNVLRHLVIEECIKGGVKEYDFLGGYTEHKRRWGAVERAGYDVFIGHPSLKNRLLFSKEIWPNGRYMNAVGLIDGT